MLCTRSANSHLALCQVTRRVSRRDLHIICILSISLWFLAVAHFVGPPIIEGGFFVVWYALPSSLWMSVECLISELLLKLQVIN